MRCNCKGKTNCCRFRNLGQVVDIKLGEPFYYIEDIDLEPKRGFYPEMAYTRMDINGKLHIVKDHG